MHAVSAGKGSISRRRALFAPRNGYCRSLASDAGMGGNQPFRPGFAQIRLTRIDDLWI